MLRRSFLSHVSAGTAALLAWHPSAARALGDFPDAQRYGIQKYGVVRSTARGNVFAMDSILQVFEDEISINDVVIAGSYCGITNLSYAVKKGVKGVICHDAGVGKDNAGISALPAGDRLGIPVAAVECFSASVSNGRSMAAGTISFANKLAKKLGVRPGQNATDAAEALLQGKAGRSREKDLPLDTKIYERGTFGGGKIYASSGLVNMSTKEDYRKDVIAWGAHCGEIAVDIMKTRMFKGCVGNDAGKAKNDSGIAGLSGLNAIGVAAASVSSRSARIGDGLSTYESGLISAANDLARRAGVRDGMPASEALRRMLLA